ncbi:hypothetical protein RDI58_013466 [Solanum bulbocastanum]|jgi:chromosome segregation ATPase
MFVL